MSIKKHFLIQFIAIFSVCYSTVLLSAAGEKKMTLILKSPDFVQMGEIPANFTCEGENISPALNWSGIPQNAKSLLLIVDDPDAPDPAAPKMTWVHWLLYNIPPTVMQLPKAVTAATLPNGILLGKNDWKKTAYGGPCPPTGRHRYFHKLYALDIVLPDLHEPDKAQLEKAMSGHVIEKTELIATYQRGN
jgi:Raf kinase inhibitor-like YbhB/YbcL family protein